MYSDLPQFTRCCFCAPLRIGLLVWGYIKLALSGLQWLVIADGIVQTVRRQYPLPPALIILIILEIIDVLFSIILIIAAHRKQERLFYVYYIYSVVFFVILAIGCSLQLMSLVFATIAFPHPYLMSIVVMSFVAATSLLLVQVYIVLLVRSELFKLRDRSNIQFTNHAGEAQCNANVEKV